MMMCRNEERSYKLDAAGNMDISSTVETQTKMRKFLMVFSILALISVIEVILVSGSINKVS